MSIKRDIARGDWIVSFSKRHPMKGTAVTLRRRAATQAAAKALERQLIVEVEGRCLGVPSLKWIDVLDEFKNEMAARDLQEHTVYCYMSGLAHHTLPIWQSKLVSEITTLDIRDLVTVQLATKAESHRKNILKYIRAVFRFALEKEYVQRDPTPQLKFRKSQKLGKVLTESQMSKFLRKAEETNSPWFWHWLLACYTGMRNGELYALKWDRIDLENRRILVNLSWQKNGGFKSTKSGDDRWLDIAPDLVGHFRRLRLETGATGFVLPRLPEWEKCEQARCLRMFLMGMGLPAIRFHDLRASWATMLLNRGVEPIKVMTMGGWKDLKTMQIYIRKAGVEVRGAMDGISLLPKEASDSKVMAFGSFSVSV